MTYTKTLMILVNHWICVVQPIRIQHLFVLYSFCFHNSLKQLSINKFRVKAVYKQRI